MQPSPIQLKDLNYIGFKVWARPLAKDEEEPGTSFNFDGVMIGESVDVAEIDPTTFAIKLRIVIENKEGTVAPYDIDIEVAGLFEINEIIKLEDRKEMIEVNGCAVIYGAIRDIVLNLTSRSANGPLMMPTVNFLDRRKKRAAQPA